MNELLQETRNRGWLSSRLAECRLSPLAIAAATIIANALVNLPLAFAFDAWRPAPGRLGLSNDWRSITWYVLVQPAIFAYLEWLQTASPRLFGQLVVRGAVQSTDYARQVLATCRARFQTRCLAPAAATLGSAWAVGSVVTFTLIVPSHPWFTAHPALLYVRRALDRFAVGALAVVVYDVVVIVVALTNLLRDESVRFMPFHPDGAGGMGVIGEFTANLGYLVAGLGVTLSVGLISDPGSLTLANYPPMVEGPLYLLVSLLVFFIPLRATHSVMVSYRDRLLESTASRLDKVLAQLDSEATMTATEAGELLRRMSGLAETRALVAQFPVWPVRLAGFRKYFGLVISALLPALIPVILE